MFSKIPPSISIPLFFGVTSLSVITSFLISNIYGILITSFALYFLSGTLFNVTPLGPVELIGWISSQSETTKTALLSALVTITGFFIAYATATSNWKAQALSQLRLQAAAEIDAFFSECAKLITDCQIYTKGLIEAAEKINNGVTMEEGEFLAHWNRDQGQDFLQKRLRLSALGVDVHHLQARYSALLFMAPRLKRNMDFATKALNNMIGKIWFNVPYHINGDTNPIETFINQVDLDGSLEFSRSVDDNFGQMSFTSGGARGELQSSVAGFGFWSLIHLYKDRKIFMEAVTKHHQSANSPEGK